MVREPTWSSQAVSHNTPDYGNTYVEINLTAQHLYYYKDGSLIIDSDFVSGRLSQGRETPTGIYKVDYKQRNATLKGEDYSTPVSFWMPFNGGVGMHDATWRGSFGGSIYVSNGSHGCINLPYSVAETIYNNIDAGCCVFVYKLGGTEGGAAGTEEETDTVSGSTESDDSDEGENADDSGEAPDNGDNEESADDNASDEEANGDTGEPEEQE